MKNIVKILTALATLAGVVYLLATYGEQIVAWAKKLLNALPKCPSCEQNDAPVEESPAEEADAPAAEAAPAEDPAPAEEPAPEIVVSGNEPVADETDFAE